MPAASSSRKTETNADEGLDCKRRRKCCQSSNEDASNDVSVHFRRRLIADGAPEESQIGFVELFAGIGGSALGLVLAGWTCLLLVEIRQYLHATLRDHFPSVPIVCDVNQLLSLPSKTTVLCGGFPCGDLSTNGLQAGLAEGTDSSLVRKQIELAAECDELQWLLLENVPGMLTRPRTERGQPKAEAPIYQIVELLNAAGFRWAWREYTLVDFGIPQERVRVLLLASKTNDPRPILFGHKGPGLRDGGIASSPDVPRPMSEPSPVYMFDLSTGRSTARVWHPFAHTITRSMLLIVVLADGTMGEVLIEDLEVIAGLERGHTRRLCHTDRLLALAESCAPMLVQHLADRINLGAQCGTYSAEQDEVFRRGADAPSAAWGGSDDFPGEMYRVVGELPAVAIPPQTLGDVITGAGRLPPNARVQAWLPRVVGMPRHVLWALQLHGYVKLKPRGVARAKGQKPLSAVGTRVWAARYTGDGFKSVFSLATVQSATLVGRARDCDDRLLAVKFDDSQVIHKIPHHDVFPSDAKPTGLDEGHAQLAAPSPLFDLRARRLASEGSLAGCISIAGNEAVGTLVDIYWQLDQMWMKAKITDYFPKTGLHKVEYLDGQATKPIKMWTERIRLTAGAPKEGPQAAAKPGGHGWYPCTEALAADAAARAETQAGAARMAHGVELVERVMRDGLKREDLIKAIQANEAFRTTPVGSEAQAVALNAVLETLRNERRAANAEPDAEDGAGVVLA